MKTQTKTTIPVPALNKVASELVGDGMHPNVFFVTDREQVVLITLDFKTAYTDWALRSMYKDRETCLEDRLQGTLSSVEPRSDTDPTLVRLVDCEEYWRDKV